ncbi:MAG: LCP family protein [Clostridia bacterium]|nr:LCP family protein [Clostridia bacterium]
MAKNNQTTGNKKGLRIFLKVLLVLLIILVIFFGTVAWYIYSKLSKVNYVKLENIEINEGVAEQLKGYRNIAVFGVDARSDRYVNTRSDVIMIVSLNQDTNDVKVTSVYRDTYLNIDGHGFDKVTHAYAYGGPELAINTLNKNLDLNISEFVTVNFSAVIDIVDSIGGVEIDVDSEELVYLNKYIQNVNREFNRNDAALTRTGVSNLTGAQALAYTRIRYTAGGDFKRTERSREVLNATFGKAKKLSVGKLNNLADVLLPKVYTNIKATEILGMIPSIYNINITEGEGWPYKTAFYNNGISYVAPVTLEQNVKQLHQHLFGNDGYEVSDKVKEYSNGIIKRTGYK